MSECRCSHALWAACKSRDCRLRPCKHCCFVPRCAQACYKPVRAPCTDKAVAECVQRACSTDRLSESGEMMTMALLEYCAAQRMCSAPLIVMQTSQDLLWQH